MRHTFDVWNAYSLSTPENFLLACESSADRGQNWALFVGSPTANLIRLAWLLGVLGYSAVAVVESIEITAGTYGPGVLVGLYSRIVC